MQVRASLQTTIEELPSVLVLHLQRFKYDTRGVVTKIGRHVAFGLKLSVASKFLSRALAVENSGKDVPYLLTGGRCFVFLFFCCLVLM